MSWLLNNLLAPVSVEVRVNLELITDSSPWASQTGINVSLTDAKPGSFDGATFNDFAGETTDGSGVLVIDVSGVYAAGTEVTVLGHKTAGGVGGEDDFYIAGVYDVSLT